MAGLQAHVPVISNRHEHKQNQGCYMIVHTHNLVWRMVKVLLVVARGFGDTALFYSFSKVYHYKSNSISI